MEWSSPTGNPSFRNSWEDNSSYVLSGVGMASATIVRPPWVKTTIAKFAIALTELAF